MAHRAATGVVRGSFFEQCEYRSVKLQIASAIVADNTFIRTTHGQCEVDAQWAGTLVSQNVFQVQLPVHLQGAGLIQEGLRDADSCAFRKLWRLDSGKSGGLNAA